MRASPASSISPPSRASAASVAVPPASRSSCADQREDRGGEDEAGADHQRRRGGPGAFTAPPAPSMRTTMAETLSGAPRAERRLDEVAAGGLAVAARRRAWRRSRRRGRSASGRRSRAGAGRPSRSATSRKAGSTRSAAPTARVTTCACGWSLGLGGVELAAVDQVLHQRVVAGQLLERRRRARGSRGCRRPRRRSRGRPRSAARPRSRRSAPRPSARARRRISAWAAAKASCSERPARRAVRQAGEGVDDDVGGEVAVAVAAHAVGDRPERAARVGQDRVLVDLAHAAAVAERRRRSRPGAGSRRRRDPERVIGRARGTGAVLAGGSFGVGERRRYEYNCVKRLYNTIAGETWEYGSPREAHLGTAGGLAGWSLWWRPAAAQDLTRRGDRGPLPAAARDVPGGAGERRARRVARAGADHRRAGRGSGAGTRVDGRRGTEPGPRRADRGSCRPRRRPRRDHRR